MNHCNPAPVLCLQWPAKGRHSEVPGTHGSSPIGQTLAKRQYERRSAAARRQTLPSPRGDCRPPNAEQLIVASRCRHIFPQRSDPNPRQRGGRRSTLTQAFPAPGRPRSHPAHRPPHRRFGNAQRMCPPLPWPRRHAQPSLWSEREDVRSGIGSAGVSGFVIQFPFALHQLAPAC